MENKQISSVLPLVTLIGRPNVGKSSLFNRLIRQNKALTHDLPGVTRDRIYGDVTWGEKKFSLVDTGGLVLDGEQDFEREIFFQAKEVVEHADLILMVVDGREGLTPLDEQLAQYLRQSNKQILIVVNKVDGLELEEKLCADFYALGLPLIAVSAAHRFGISGLMEDVENCLPESEEQEKASPDGLTLSMLGRPNAGKSSIINALVGEKRMIVSSIAGTTRDSVDVSIERDGRIYTFVDTAGVRKKNKIVDELERFSILRSLRSSKRAQMVVLVLDALDGLRSQDKKLLAFLDKEKTPFIVAVNKIDLIPHRQRPKTKEYFKEQLRFCHHVPVLYTSAVSKAGLGAILPMAEKIWAQCQIRVSTGQLNRLIQEATQRHQPPVIKRRRAKFYYLTQPETCPPTFVFFVNDPELIKPSYARYLESQLRKLFELDVAPIRVHFRGSHKKK